MNREVPDSLQLARRPRPAGALTLSGPSLGWRSEGEHRVPTDLWRVDR